MDRPVCMIYGANGFTGRLVAKEAIGCGMRPILAGRRAAPIEALAAEHGLVGRAFDLADTEAACAALAGVSVVANCAGPFSATSRSLIDACIATGTHYLDITGEIDVFVAARSRDAEARRAGIAVCPGVGFDVVPTDCLAAVLKEALPDATHLALGFDVAAAPSAGTAQTMVAGLAVGGRVRADGEIIAVPFAHRSRTIDFGKGATSAVTIPWGDVATAYFSTGIPNIETYAAAPRSTIVVTSMLNFIRPILASGPVQRLLRRWARTAKGPSESELGGETAYVWGEATNAAGTMRTARTTTPNGYRFTASATVMAIAHVLARSPAGGYYTPSQLMGPRCVEHVAGVTPIELQ
jgi:short subunit dehydrogenase-like uncharacterized protein